MKAQGTRLWLFAAAVLAIAAATAGPSIADAAQGEGFIQREVLHELRMIPNYSVFDDIKFSVQGTEVTLSGEVANAVLKGEAEAAVKGVQGVTKVTNNIKELPLSPGDQQIRRAEYRAIYGDPQFTKYAWESVQAIHIIVENGHVSLEGVVDSEADKNAANIRANSVPGVFSVQNNLQVQGPR